MTHQATRAATQSGLQAGEAETGIDVLNDLFNLEAQSEAVDTMPETGR